MPRDGSLTLADLRELTRTCGKWLKRDAEQETDRVGRENQRICFEEHRDDEWDRFIHCGTQAAYAGSQVLVLQVSPRTGLRPFQV
jgi:hypothetical protein